MGDQTSEVEELERVFVDDSALPIKISYAAIEQITNNFAQKIGEGGFAVVYLGHLQNGKVAVKKLNRSYNYSDEQFSDEIACLLRVKQHKNIVRFLGYCADTQNHLMEVEGKLRIVEDQRRLLCFEYVPNGSLHHFIKEKIHGVGWNMRYQIIKGICQGLNYLHDQRIYHLDLKPANVLLDALMEPQIIDFGLSRLISEQSTMVTETSFGTIGYIAPEFIAKQQISSKSDIFSLGVTMVNVLIGCTGSIIDNWHEETLGISCPNLKICIEIAQICVDMNPRNRPTIAEIIHKLNVKETMIETVRPRINEPRNDRGSSLGQDVIKEDKVLHGSTGEHVSMWPESAGMFSKSGGKDGSRLSGCSSQAASASMPPSAKTECEILQSANVKVFTFNNLKAATRNFRPDNLVGEGGFGSVYKGWIDENTLSPCRPNTGIAVAVKKLDHESWHQELLAEVNFLGQFCHPNLVKLIGYCIDEHQLLVYEFMPRGSLDNHLFRRGSNSQPLSWNLRMKVALGAAKGLAYLHSAEAKVIYRDFKTSKILLDTDYSAKLFDFELAKDGPVDEKSHVTTRVMGTYGYAAPEYLLTGHLTAKSDIYGFGVVLLEMLSGRRAIDRKRPSGEVNLVEWARPYLTHKRKIFRIVDDRLAGQYNLKSAHTIAALALKCLSYKPEMRPTMDTVVTILQELQDSGEAEKHQEPDSGEAEKHQEPKAGTKQAPAAVSTSKSSPKPRRRCSCSCFGSST